VRYEFRWNDWNTEHIAQHGLEPADAEYVVCNARRPYPQRAGGDKYLVRGQTSLGEYIQVAYVFDPEDMVFVIHARRLNEREKRRNRRRK